MSASEPTFNIYGYPGDETLQMITEWPRPFEGLIDFVIDAWNLEYGVVREGPSIHKGAEQVVKFITGGWSGNESLLSALEENMMAYLMLWRLSARGGYHEFVRQP